jgi:magnesium transporter
MDDDGDMAEMYLTDKKERMENSFLKEHAGSIYAGVGPGGSISAPVSPVCSLPESRRFERNLSVAASRHSSSRVSDEGSEDVQELEMLLEAYFVVIDAILNKLTSVSEFSSVQLFYVTYTC